MTILIISSPCCSLIFQEQSQLASVDQMRGLNIPSLAAMEQTRMLAHTLAQNNDPKFQVTFPYENSVHSVIATLVIIW